MSNKCDRCGSVGQDRRTLFMASGYAMSEYPIPFEMVEIEGNLSKKIGTEKVDFFGREKDFPVFAPHGPETHKYQQYTLFVCKRCRAEWLNAINNWYATCPQGEDLDADEPNPDDKPLGTGIFIRYNGTTREVTLEQFNRYKETGEI